jgi:DNA-binding CsgD family transcriptional regulator
MIKLPVEIDALVDGRDTLPGGLVGAIEGDRDERDGGLVAVGPGPIDGVRGGDGAASSSAVMRGVVGEPATAAKDTFGLSRREREVLTLIADGRTNREIGERLFISQKTVGVHVGNILAKLSVSGRVEAAAVAIRLGLTEPATTGSASGR